MSFRRARTGAAAGSLCVRSVGTRSSPVPKLRYASRRQPGRERGVRNLSLTARRVVFGLVTALAVALPLIVLWLGVYYAADWT